MATGADTFFAKVGEMLMATRKQFHIASDVRPNTREGIRFAHEDCLNQCIGFFMTTDIQIEAVTVAHESIGSCQNVVVTMIASREVAE